MPDTLAQLVKKKFPGKYDHLADADLERLVISKYPGKYDKLPRTGAGSTPATPASATPAAPAAPAEEGLLAAGARRLLSPIGPLRRLGQAAAEKIEGFPRPRPTSEEEAFKLPTSGADRLKLGLGVIASPLLSVMEAGKALPGAARALLEQPGAASRGLGAGLVEGATTLSPLDVALITMGLRGRGAGGAGARVASRDIAVTPKDVGHIPTQELADVAEKISAALGKDLRQPRDLGPTLSRTKTPAVPVEGKPKPRLAGKAPTLEEAIHNILDEVRKPGGPTDVRKVTLPPSEPPRMPRTESRTASGGPIPEPGGVLGLGEESAAAARQAPQRAARAARPVVKVEDEAIDNLAAGVTRQLNAAARAAEREAEVAKRGKGTIPAPSRAVLPVKEGGVGPSGALDTTAPGTASAEAYAKGATPAEAAAARLAQQAAMETAKTRPGKLPKIPKAKGAPPAAKAPKPTLAFNEKGIAIPTSQAQKQNLPRLEKIAQTKGTVAASEAVAKEIAPPSVAPVAPPPEVGIEAQRSILAETKPHMNLVHLLEQSRQAGPAVSGAMAGGTEMGPLPAPAQALVDALNKFSTPEAGPGGVTPEVLRPPAIGGATGIRPPRNTPIAAGEGFTFLPTRESARGLSMRRSPEILRAAKPFRKFESVQEARARLKPEADVAAVRPGEGVDVAAITSAMPPQAPRTSRIQQAVEALRQRQQERRLQAEAIQAPSTRPEGSTPQQWATMDAVEEQARQLIKDHGVYDPRLIEQLHQWYGAKETARRLGIPEELARGPAGGRGKPMRAMMADLDARYNYLIKDPSGFMRTEALVGILGAAAGGTLGASIDGESVEDRAAYAISGAILGGFAGYAGVRGLEEAARTVKKAAKGDLATKARPAEEAMLAITSANMLAGPAAIKASLGSMAGVAHGLYETLSVGNKAGFQSALRYLRKQGVKDWVATLTAPTSKLPSLGAYSRDVATKTGLANRFSDYVLKNVLRPFIASDRVSVEAFKRMGISEAEGQRLLLQGTPSSWQGQTFLRMVNSNFASRLLVRFPRVRVTALERAVEFTPGLNKIWSTRPQAVKGERFTPQERLSSKQLKARAKFGAAAIGLGTAYGYFRDPDIYEAAIVSSGAGPAQVPFAVAAAAGKAVRRNQSTLAAMGKSLAGSVPQVSESDITQLPNQFVPLRSLRRALVNLGLVEE